jgi:guanylate kinase
MTKLLFIVGKTSSGKDTISKYISEKYNIPFVVSYTTRLRRISETNGVEHYFISESEMNELEKSSELIAWTKNDKTGIRYCATTDSFEGDTAIYIINPEGIQWFKDNSNGSIRFRSIYVNLNEDTIISRALLRGDKEDVLLKRLNSERDEFNAYRDSNNWDYIINTDCSLEQMYESVDKIMEDIKHVFEI